jgi:hypothetical protein
LCRGGWQKLADLKDDERRYENRAGMALAQSAAGRVILVLVVRESHKWARVSDDHSAFLRNISSIVSSERSARSDSAER